MEHPAPPPPLPRALPSPLALLQGFPLRSKAIFFRNLATMISSALALDSAVATAGTGTAPALAKEMAKLLQAGYSLSQVMARYPHYFSDYEVNIVSAGEYGGSLDTQLQLLANELERSYRLQQMVSSKMAYPILIAHAAIFIPTIPLVITKGFPAYAKTTLSILIPVYAVLALLWLVFRLSGQAGPLRAVTDHLVLWVPGLGGAVKCLASGRFLRTLAHMTEAGILPDKALSVAANTCGNAWVASRVNSAARAVGVGQRPSVTLIRSGVFPPMVTSMVAAGEEAGSVGRILEKAGDHLELELQQKIHTMMAIFPVLAMLGLGCVVGYMAYTQFSQITKLIWQ